VNQEYPETMLHGVIPMAGEGARFKVTGCELPKPLVPLQGRPLFYWAAAAMTRCLPLASLTFVVLRRHVSEHAIDAAVRAHFPQARIVVLDQLLNGPVLTCLEGVRGLGGDLPVLFNDCDHLFHSQALVHWIRSGAAAVPGHGGTLVSFASDNPAFSYLTETAPGVVAATVEKQVASRHAICGAYLFRDAALFAAAAQHYLGHCPYREFFMSGVYNSVIARGLAVNHLPLDLHLSFGTPEELAAVADHALLACM
jgi:dTDP-glucose pyrophosphorylase